MKPFRSFSAVLRKFLVNILSSLVPFGLMVIQSRPRLRELILEALRSGQGGHVGILGTPSFDHEIPLPNHFDGSWRASVAKAHVVVMNCPATMQKDPDFLLHCERLNSSPLVSTVTVLHATCSAGRCLLATSGPGLENEENLGSLIPDIKSGELLVIVPISRVPRLDDLRAYLFELQESSHALLWGKSQKQMAISSVKMEQKSKPSNSLTSDPPVAQPLILGDTFVMRTELTPWLDANSGIFESDSSSLLQLKLTEFLAKKGWTHSNLSSFTCTQGEVRKLVEQIKTANLSSSPVMPPFDFHRLVRKQLSLAGKHEEPVQKTKKRLLIIQPILGGGLVHADNIMSEAAASSFDVFWMSTSGGSLGLYSKDGDTQRHQCILEESFEPVDPQSHRSVSYDGFLLKAIIKLKIDLVLVQHLANQSFGIREVCDSLGVKFIIAAHDFYAGCMSHNLLDETNRYCGGVCSAGSGPCKTTSWPSAEVSNLKNGLVGRFRQGASDVLRGASGHLFPDASTKAILESIHGQIFRNSLVLPFPIPKVLRAPSSKPARRRIAVIGDLRENKGADLVKKLGSKLGTHAISIHIFGNAHPSLIGVGVHHGSYKPEQLSSMIKKVEPDFVIMTSPGPETFSFVLSEALCLGLPVLARNLGAFSTRLEGKQFARLVDTNEETQWTDAILDVYNPAQLETMRNSLLEWQEQHDANSEEATYVEKLSGFLSGPLTI